MTTAAANSTTTGTLPANTYLRVLGDSIVTITRDGAFVASQSTARDNFVGPYPIDSDYSVVAGDAAIDIKVTGEEGPTEALVPVRAVTDANGQTVLVGGDGTEYPLGQPTTTLISRTAAQSVATGDAIGLNVLNIDEDGAADTTNGIINVAADVEYLRIKAGARFNNLATSAGTYRRISVEMDDGLSGWVQAPMCMCEELYVATSTADSTLHIDSPKLPKSMLDTAYGVPVTRLRLLAEHDNGSTLALSAIGPAGTANSFLSVEFFR